MAPKWQGVTEQYSGRFNLSMGDRISQMGHLPLDTVEIVGELNCYTLEKFLQLAHEYCWGCHRWKRACALLGACLLLESNYMGFPLINYGHFDHNTYLNIIQATIKTFVGNLGKALFSLQWTDCYYDGARSFKDHEFKFTQGSTTSWSMKVVMPNICFIGEL